MQGENMVGLQSITETLKHFLQTFQAHTLFPAAALTFTSLLLCPQYISIRRELDNTEIAIFLIILTIIISNLFAAFNGPIIRFFEGYLHEESFVLNALTGWFFFLNGKKHEKRHKKLIREIIACERDIEKLELIEKEYGSNLSIDTKLNNPDLKRVSYLINHIRAKRNMLLAQLEGEFAPFTTLPTSFGNTLLAFEYYPKKRYKIESVYLWPCLLPILEEKKFMQFLNNEKSRVDFLLNLIVVSFVIAVESILLFLFYEGSLYYPALLCVLVCLIIFLYIAVVFAARDWGTMVKAAFDLYRYDLHKSLHLKPISDGNLHEERKVWDELSEFLIYGNFSRFKGFYYPINLWSDDNKNYGGTE